MDEAVRSDVRAAADAVRAEASGLLEASARAASDIASNGADMARRAMREGQAVAGEQIDAGRIWLEEAARANPLRALGIAAAVGLAVGWLLLKDR
jgi:ElaB/YqjD/DUF883 family membrane-anchored ribosome-binding protein